NNRCRFLRRLRKPQNQKYDDDDVNRNSDRRMFDRQPEQKPKNEIDQNAEAAAIPTATAAASAATVRVAAADTCQRFSGKQREPNQGKRCQSYAHTAAQSEATEFQIPNSRFKTLHLESTTNALSNENCGALFQSDKEMLRFNRFRNSIQFNA